MSDQQNQLQEILTRGVASILPDKNGLAKLMSQKTIRLYLGIDPTGAFLHLGHAVVLRKLQQFADLGHEVILLVGNGTVKIGDPTGRDESRPMLTDQEIEKNFLEWKKQASKILNFDKISLKYNGDWLDKLTLPDMIKLMAKTTVQQLIERDMFQERMKKGQPIHGHEIIYPMLQGYDSVAMDVDLEIGGTDQTFNMMMGRTLQKIYHNHDKWVLTTPIINGTDGRKMSKSFNNYIALTDEASDIYGKIMSLKDEQIMEYFELLTDVSLDEITEMKKQVQQGENPMTFKKKLAFIITKDLQSEEAAQEAATNFSNAFQKRQLPTDLKEIKVTKNNLTLLELVKTCQPDKSSGDAKRLIKQGAIELIEKGEKPTDLNQIIEIKTDMVLKIGKKDFYKIKA